MTETLEMALPLRPTHEFYTSALPPSSNEGAEEFAPRLNTVHSQRRHHGRVNKLHQLGRLIRQVVVAPDLCQLRRVRQEATAEARGLAMTGWRLLMVREALISQPHPCM